MNTSLAVTLHSDFTGFAARHFRRVAREPLGKATTCTNSLFRQESLAAVIKFKYRPRVIDGVAVEVSGVQNRFVFRITD
jgi:hypothetical protein